MKQALKLKLLVFALLGFTTIATATPGDVLCTGADSYGQDIEVFIAYDRHGEPPSYLEITIGPTVYRADQNVEEYRLNKGRTTNPYWVTYIEAVGNHGWIQLMFPDDTQEESFREGYLEYSLPDDVVGRGIIIQCPY